MICCSLVLGSCSTLVYWDSISLWYRQGKYEQTHVYKFAPCVLIVQRVFFYFNDKLYFLVFNCVRPIYSNKNKISMTISTKIVKLLCSRFVIAVTTVFISVQLWHHCFVFLCKMRLCCCLFVCYWACFLRLLLFS